MKLVAFALLVACSDPGDPGDSPDAMPPGSDGPVDPARGAVQYPEDRRHSPITAEVAAHLAAIANVPGRDDHAFSKIGDSITAAPNFMACFAGTHVDLGGHDLATAQDWFAGTASYDRTSEAATIGWAARSAIAGDPSPLETEIADHGPRYATVMFGTNDVGYRTIDQYGSDLWTIVDDLSAAGVIPLLSTIPPYDDDPAIDARVPTFNRIVRALAQGRMVPLVDFHRELEPLPGHALGPDDIHPTTSPAGACVLTAEGLGYGFNVRNLITLEQLDRARRGTALDDDAPRRAGAGTAADPYVVTLPFGDLNDTRAGASELAGYACGTQDESGPEVIYRIELAARTHLAAHVVDRGDTDVDVHILDGSLAPSACIARNNASAEADVGPGTAYVVVDSFGGAAHAGEYLLVIE